MAGAKLHLEVRNGIAVVTMDDGKANTIEWRWIEEAEALLDELATRRAQATLWRGRATIFSAGLDLKALPAMAAEELRRFVAAYRRIKTRIYTHPLPMVADVNGHALAGGAVLLLCADWAVTDAAPKRIGLNETQVGITLPAWVVALAWSRLAPPYRNRALQAGESFDPETARAAGFVDLVTADPDERSAAAWEIAQRLSALPAGAFAGTKRLVRERVLELWPEAETEPISSHFGGASSDPT